MQVFGIPRSSTPVSPVWPSISFRIQFSLLSFSLLVTCFWGRYGWKENKNKMPTLGCKRVHFSVSLTVFMDTGCILKLPGTFKNNSNTWALIQTNKIRHSGGQVQAWGIFYYLPRWICFVILFSWRKETEGKIWSTICRISGNRKQGRYFREQMAEGFFSSLKIPEVVNLLLPFIDRDCSKIAFTYSNHIRIKQTNRSAIIL